MVAVLLLFGLITGILWVLWWSFSRERIIIDYCLGRNARASCIIDSQEWRWLPTKSPRWIELARYTPISFLLDDKRYDIVCWKDAPTGIFSIHYAWNALCPFLSKVKWWKLVWHKQIVMGLSFILWFAVHEALLTQDKLMSYGLIQVNKCLIF